MTAENESLRKHRTQRGVALIEVMIAMVVLTIGFMGVLMSFANAIEATEWAQEDLIARHKALDAMESIYTARNSQQLPFASINNVVNGGIFLSGALPLLCAGPDGTASQSMYLASSVSTRNMSFCNSYSSQTTAC